MPILRQAQAVVAKVVVVLKSKEKTLNFKASFVYFLS
jgi:hypothetical protein